MAESAGLRLGWLINPYAGVGGPAALKGSDAPTTQARAQAGDMALTAPTRAASFWKALLSLIAPGQPFEVVTLAGAMGQDALPAALDRVRLIDYSAARPSTRQDTVAAARGIVAAGVDLLLFVGGDGTARDVCSAVGASQPVLGVPAGVKMHSGVYAINPQLAAELVAQLIKGGLVNAAAREVRDIDEEAFRAGVVKASHFGEMLVPEEGHYVQQVKQGGLEVEELVLLDIADYLQDSLPEDTLVILGPGSTTHQVARNWGVSATLLGVDLIKAGSLLAGDVDAHLLSQHVSQHSGPVRLIVTAIGGQGHIIGRGNQQITGDILRCIGRNNLVVVATRTKLATLGGRPLLIDSGDPELDVQWQGLLPVLTGFDDRVLYPLGHFLSG